MPRARCLLRRKTRKDSKSPEECVLFDQDYDRRLIVLPARRTLFSGNVDRAQTSIWQYRGKHDPEINPKAKEHYKHYITYYTPDFRVAQIYANGCGKSNFGYVHRFMTKKPICLRFDISHMGYFESPKIAQCVCDAGFNGTIATYGQYEAGIHERNSEISLCDAQKWLRYTGTFLCETQEWIMLDWAVSGPRTRSSRKKGLRA